MGKSLLYFRLPHMAMQCFPLTTPENIAHVVEYMNGSWDSSAYTCSISNSSCCLSSISQAHSSLIAFYLHNRIVNGAPFPPPVNG